MVAAMVMVLRRRHRGCGKEGIRSEIQLDRGEALGQPDGGGADTPSYLGVLDGHQPRKFAVPKCSRPC